jgi:plasmid stability protein
MASITIRKLPESTKHKLRIRAAQNGRSMEQEAREILRTELNKSPELEGPKTGADLVKSIREIFEPLGGVDLEIPPRGPIRDPDIR